MPETVEGGKCIHIKSSNSSDLYDDGLNYSGPPKFVREGSPEKSLILNNGQQQSTNFWVGLADKDNKIPEYDVLDIVSTQQSRSTSAAGEPSATHTSHHSSSGGQRLSFEIKPGRPGLEIVSTSTMCINCFVRKPGVVFEPCGHAKCCNKCSKIIQTCPDCNVLISTRYKM